MSSEVRSLKPCLQRSRDTDPVVRGEETRATSSEVQTLTGADGKIIHYRDANNQELTEHGKNVRNANDR